MRQNFIDRIRQCQSTCCDLWTYEYAGDVGLQEERVRIRVRRTRWKCGENICSKRSVDSSECGTKYSHALPFWHAFQQNNGSQINHNSNGINLRICWACWAVLILNSIRDQKGWGEGMSWCLKTTKSQWIRASQKIHKADKNFPPRTDLYAGLVGLSKLQIDQID